MIPMIIIKEVKVVEKNSEEYGINEEILMENAGKGSAEAILKIIPKNKKILIACGTGNNGGDGMVCARYLKDYREVTVWLIEKPENIKTSLAKKNFEKIYGKLKIEYGKDISLYISKDTVIIDALLGTGIKGQLKDPYKKAVEEINKSNCEIISLDVPTGLGATPSIKPNITLTMHDIKEGMNEENSGEIHIINIGIPKEAVMYTGKGETILYPIPDQDCKKGDNGKVAIIAGGPYTGAAYFTSMAALKIGTDLVYSFVPEKIYGTMCSYTPDIIFVPYKGDFLNENILPIFNEKDYNAIALGNGIGREKKVIEIAKQIVKNCSKPIVIDADGLYAIKDEIDVIKNKKIVLTPHRGEFQYTFGEVVPEDLEGKVQLVEKYAKKYGVTILLKGKIDIISDGTHTKLNKTGNSRMAVGGTGDILAGIVAGLMAKGLNPFDASRLGAYFNGYLGDIVFARKRYAMTSKDMIDGFSEMYVGLNL
jgi:NAD(P)H-hydrate epimerase